MLTIFAVLLTRGHAPCHPTEKATLVEVALPGRDERWF
jgi:hypothetical protein